MPTPEPLDRAGWSAVVRSAHEDGAAWHIGSTRDGVTLSEKGLERRQQRLAWTEIERLELVVEPAPFRNWGTWALASLLNLVAMSGYTPRYGHLRLHVLKRGTAFQATWDLGRTPFALDKLKATALSSWIAALTHGSKRPELLSSGPQSP